jgi:choline dehydrogenase-like flavoprotein
MGLGRSNILPRRKCEALRAIDVSIMPTVVSGKTNAGTIMIAEKGPT